MPSITCIFLTVIVIIQNVSFLELILQKGDGCTIQKNIELSSIKKST